MLISRVSEKENVRFFLSFFPPIDLGVHELVRTELAAAAQRLAEMETRGRGAIVALLFRRIVFGRLPMGAAEPPLQDGRARVQHHQSGPASYKSNISTGSQ